MRLRTISVALSLLVLVGCRKEQPAPTQQNVEPPKAAPAIPDGFYELRALHSNKCAALAVPGTTQGLVQRKCTENSDQRWAFRHLGDSVYEVKSANSGQCLDVEGGKTNDGATVIPWSCNGGSNQKWRVVKLGEQYFLKPDMGAEKCLDVRGEDKADSAGIIQWSCKSSDNQKWILTRKNDAGKPPPAPPAPGGGTTCERAGKLWVLEKGYLVENNVTGAVTKQCITAAGASFTVTTSEHKVAPKAAPVAYPSLMMGCHRADCSAKSNLPKQVSAIGSLPSSWNFESAAGVWSASYDLLFDRSAKVNGQNGGAELTIWLDASGTVNPRGTRGETVDIAGAKWEIWVETTGSKHVTYRRVEGTRAVNFDLKLFIADAKTHGYLKDEWYLTRIQAGFSLWEGGAGLKVNSFSANVE
jgi:hypothetical protein